MGSFYSTCSISNMTLSRQKTSILLLVPVYTQEFKNNLRMIGHIQSFFAPFGFPVHGTYDDYGYITNIKRDESVEIIEKYFGCDIDAILKNIGDVRRIPDNILNREFYMTLGKTYLRTDVLEYMERGWEKLKSNNGDKFSAQENLSKLLSILEMKKQSCERSISNHQLRYRTYIDSLANKNMFEELDISINMSDEIMKQKTFLKSMHDLKKPLLPSAYGSQNDNWCEIYKFNDFVNDVIVKDMEEKINDYKKYGEEYPETEIINIHKSIIRDRKINQLLD